jgi:hypothetical protein
MSRGGIVVSSVYVSPTFIGIQINAAMQVADVNSVQRTIIPSPENRKVQGSTPVTISG